MNDIKLNVEDTAAFFDHARALARGLDDGRLAEVENHLSFPSLEALLRTLTPNRWALLRALKVKGASSIRALSLTLGRDYKAVHSDVAGLLESGLIERGGDGRVSVPWTRVSAEMDLAASGPVRGPEGKSARS